MADETDFAEPFREVAADIDRNRGTMFGGAFVVVPPDGEPHKLVLLDNSGNPAAFWALLQTRASIALAELEAQQRSSGAFGGRR